jgi:alkanesulfonate monooxygenase SsuD/methylene tetrahydromethanopterin reductase-like flavin-dependent oxidoreductase (luciferase family)
VAIQFGFCIPAESCEKERRASWVKDINRALSLVSGHFDSAWMVDHMMFDDGDVLEAFTSLSYFAALHAELKFGHAVLCQSFRKPALVAKMGATLQFLSDGRFMLGLGAGWHEAEYRAYGYDFPSDAVRVEQLEEAIRIIKAMWTEEKPSFEGKHYQIKEAYCEPKPSPVPSMMIGAFKPKMLRLTAQYADCWNVSSTNPAKYKLMNTVFERACTEVGRDSASVRRSWIGGCACAATEAEAEQLTEGRWQADSEDDFGFVGSPKQVLAQLRPFIDLGVDTFIFDCGGFPNLTSLEMLINEVLPELA